jgi:hypothetical protein
MGGPFWGPRQQTRIGRGSFFSCILRSELSGGSQGGTLYKNIALTGLLVYVTLSAPTSLHAAEAQDCSLKRYASIDLEESPNGHLFDDAHMPLDLTDAELATAATACRAMAYQEGERAKKMENPGMRAPIENTAKRYAELAERLEGARKRR